MRGAGGALGVVISFNTLSFPIPPVVSCCCHVCMHHALASPGSHFGIWPAYTLFCMLRQASRHGITAVQVQIANYIFEVSLAAEVVGWFYGTFILTTPPQMEPGVYFYPAGTNPCPTSSACFSVYVWNIGPASSQTDAAFAVLDAYAISRCGNGFCHIAGLVGALCSLLLLWHAYWHAPCQLAPRSTKAKWHPS